MSWTPVPLLGFASGVTVLASLRRTGAFLMAALILARWAISVAANALVSPEFENTISPAIDFSLGLGCVLLSVKRGLNWPMALAVLYLAQTAAHMAYNEHAHTPHRLYIMQVSVNVVTWLQLFLVVGGPRAHVAVDLFRSLFPSPRSRHRVGIVSSRCIWREHR